MQGGGSVENKMFSPSFTFQNQLPQKQSSGSNGTDHSSLSFTPSPCSCTEEEINPSDTENRLYLASLSLQYQQLVDRYTLCITQLQDTANQGELLRQENAKLRVANKDLTKRLAILTQASIQTRYMSSNVPSLSIINDFRSLCLGDNGRAANEVKETSPTSVIGNNRFEKKNTERVAMPKSISIRSSGYLRMPPSSSADVTTPVTNDMAMLAWTGRGRIFSVCNKNQETGSLENQNTGGAGANQENAAISNSSRDTENDHWDLKYVMNIVRGDTMSCAGVCRDIIWNVDFFSLIEQNAADFEDFYFGTLEEKIGTERFQYLGKHVLMLVYDMFDVDHVNYSSYNFLMLHANGSFNSWFNVADISGLTQIPMDLCPDHPSAAVCLFYANQKLHGLNKEVLHRLEFMEEEGFVRFSHYVNDRDNWM